MISLSGNDKSIYYKVLRYLNKHREDYNTHEYEGILDYSMNPDIEAIAKIEVVREVYDRLGLIPDEINIYVAFMNLINEKFGIDGKNILEVGCGVIPTLGERIHLKQKTGTITVYDPRLTSDFQETDHFTLKKETFRNDTPIGNTNLLIGLMPCKGAEALLESAIKNKLDFMLWFCEGGPHGEYFDFFESDDEWLNYFLCHASNGVEDNNMGKLKELKMPRFSKYPIIYNQR